jgi:tetratricopeptide (TPR) repeat protein
MGRYDDALPLFQQALEGSNSALGALHPSTLASVLNLGAFLVERGDVGAARPLLERAVKGLKETMGAEHPSTQNAKEWLSRLNQ